eukprot:CAMPEP_0194320206 /NCGR_PEP_ID=MMETSP0171-20130528/16575_1 /TAXON_ID=218684 /ORGANISM="Corethron pennatum, Strain L29A3" /LENGTH=511 /DNA_ID=CAMNT_0039077687 /DNA_START=306 /DNA_END=1841 /DNA_ORIENTATION=+
MPATSSSIRDRVANLVARRESVDEFSRLPPPQFTTAEEVTGHVRRYAEVKRNYTATGLEKIIREPITDKYIRLPHQSRFVDYTNPEQLMADCEEELGRLPSEERCRTFRLPEAATELFLRAEKWHFQDYDDRLPLFVPFSYEDPVLTFDRIKGDRYEELFSRNCDFKDWYDLEHYSPAWIDIGYTACVDKFRMCIDPESKEFGDLKSWRKGGDPDTIQMACDESHHENGDNFLRFLERDAETFSEKEGRMDWLDSVFSGPMPAASSSIRDRVANLVARRESKDEFSRLPPPIFTTAEEVTAHVRRYAEVKRNRMAIGLEKKIRNVHERNQKKWKAELSRLPSHERGQTFRLPEAATELFLRVEKWHFYDQYSNDLPLFMPSSCEDPQLPSFFFDFYDGTLEHYSPAWIGIGQAFDGYYFLMCIDPESKEFGNLKGWHDGGGPESIDMFCDESHHENGENFLRFLERDAEIFFAKKGQIERDESVFHKEMLWRLEKKEKHRKQWLLKHRNQK